MSISGKIFITIGNPVVKIHVFSWNRLDIDIFNRNSRKYIPKFTSLRRARELIDICFRFLKIVFLIEQKYAFKHHGKNAIRAVGDR